MVIAQQMREKVIFEALKWYGLSEKSGADHDQNILKFFEDSGHGWVKSDETPWCAAFVGAVLKACGIAGTRKLNAKSYLDWGLPTSSPKIGDVVVFWRGSPEAATGHVGFFISQRDGQIFVLSGNQSNRVNVAPYAESRLLAIRTY